MFNRVLKLLLFTLVWYSAFSFVSYICVKDSNTTGLIWCILFLVIGLFLVNLVIKETKRVTHIIYKGTKYVGVIVDFTDDTTMWQNKQPMVALVVRYFDSNSNIKEVVIPTGDFDMSKHPLKTVISFYVDDSTKEAIYCGKSKEHIDIDTLLNIDLESNKFVQRMNQVACTCPNCGATLMLYSIGKTKCSYCGNWILLDSFADANSIYDVSTQGELLNE